MRTYEERAKSFIELLFPMIKDCDEDVWDYIKATEKFNATYKRNVQCRHGLARVAFITSDYVVKFDYDHDETTVIGGCEDEIKIYAIAERHGFDYLFAKITRYRYNGKTFYIMPRIRGVGSKDYCGGYADEYMTEKEREFCDSLNLTDLHPFNYGFRNHHVCLVDYACRYDDDSDSGSDL